jgi:hypothetical protein
MQGIHTYIPEINHVSRVYSITAIPCILLMVHITLSSILNSFVLYISTFRSVCAVPNIAVFCSSLTSCFPVMLLKYFLNYYYYIIIIIIIIMCRMSGTSNLKRYGTCRHTYTHVPNKKPK